jgi:hypothetical protein
MSEIDGTQAQQIAKSFEKILNSHGYGFQYSVLREIETLATQGQSPWALTASEFPVEVRGAGTRIDFILKNYRRPLYMIAECKRVNPALSDWCFAKAPDSLVNPSGHGVFVEAAYVPDLGAWRTKIEHQLHSKDIYHIALETKTREKGDPGGQGRGAIEKAATQVCRGLNGLVDFFSADSDAFADARDGNRVIGFLPVIFTTARLWTSSVDLSSADLHHGKFDLSDVDIEERPWLFYHYHQSPGLKHSVHTDRKSGSLDDILYSTYVRTIAIVSASGIAEFMGFGAWTG